MNIASIDLSILWSAFLAGLLVLSTHVPLGQQVLKRGIVFIDLALAQVAGLGIIAMDSLGIEPHGWKAQASACAAALLGALLLACTQKRWAKVQEALVGTLFVAAACAGLLMLAHNPHGGEHLQELLSGQILWTTPHDLLPVAIIYSGVLGLWFRMRKRLGELGFYLIFAITVTASVQLVGVYLVFASLIVPALATRNMTEKMQVPMGYAIGTFGYVIGLMLSAFFDLPTGPIIVCSLICSMITVWAFKAFGRCHCWAMGDGRT